MCRMRIPTIIAFLTVAAWVVLAGQKTAVEDRETDPLVLKKLEWFQGLKFGLMMHWGPYSQWGIVESWSICSEDEPWCRRRIPDYTEYKKQYENLFKTFNPLKFDPERWAAAARYAGMKYVVFTTKHHDGFSMFDTRRSEYRITSPECPFSKNPRANVTKEVFAAFRKAGFGIGAYFSKADWHSPDYWAPEWATPDRQVNYDTEKYPERWKRFSDFTTSQIEELMTGYGNVDILWLDAGWVRPYPPLPQSLRGLIKWPPNQDLDMPRIAVMSRSHQPGLIVVDRTVGGKYENYRTPEQEIPDKPLPYIWETCMTMGNSWSFNPNDRYKPASRLIHLLVDIVSKGGNFLLNIGPNAEGELPAESLSRLKEIGDWVKVNGEAIYGTRPVAPFKEAKSCFTALSDGTVYAIYLADEDEPNPPAKLMLYSHAPRSDGRIEMLGVRGSLRWESVGKGVFVYIPDSVVKNPPCHYAWTLKIL
jgi:alpha-L-fucosidase